MKRNKLFGLVVGMLIAASGAQALNMKNYEWTPINSKDIELKAFSHLVPYEVTVRGTHPGYYIVCGNFDADDKQLDIDWKFAEYSQTLFLFERGYQGIKSVATKCVRSQQFRYGRSK